jgi:hypothetical protein
MKAQELRIGNYISEIGVDIDYNGNKISDGTFEVVKVDIDILKDILGCWEVYYTEIPLTQEWLIKFGFVKDKYDNSYVLDNFSIFLDKGLKENIYLKSFDAWGLEEWNVVAGAKITSVHQLQNLHFALKNEELC